MPPFIRFTLVRVLALAGLAVMAALISNALPFPARRLAWSGSGVPRPVPSVQGERPKPLEPIQDRQAGQAPQPPGQRTPAPEARPPRTTSPSLAPPPPQAAVEANPIREISGPEAWQLFQGGAPFLDARRSAEFAEGHIPGAWSTPVWESDLDDRLLAFKAGRRPGPEDPIVIYCGGGDCRDSHLLAGKLLNEGYFHLLIYRDGYPAWLAQGHPAEKGRP